MQNNLSIVKSENFERKIYRWEGGGQSVKTILYWYRNS